MCRAMSCRLGCGSDLDLAFDLLHLVHVECSGRRAVDHRSGGDVEPGAVALAHDRRACEQAAGERARLVGARAEVVERVEAVVDTRDRDPAFAVVQVVGNDEVVGDRVAWPERAEGSVASSVIGFSFIGPFSTGSRE